jgi:glycosyltransferase involved in cell wall biosynthesis
MSTPSSVPRRLSRVLYAIGLDPSRKLGSMEEQILMLARAFRACDGFLLPLFLTTAPASSAIGFAEQGIEVECLDLDRFSWAKARQLVRLIRKNRIEIIHWGMVEPLRNGYLWALTLLTPQVRHFYTDHSSRDLPLRPPDGSLVRLVKRLLLKRYRKVIGVSRFVERCLHDQRVWSGVTCRLHFINTDRFRPDPSARQRVREQLGADDRFVAVTVAHLTKAKGVDVFLRALARVPNVTGWIVGEGVEEANFKTLARELGLDERVRFLGNQVHVQPYLQAADCFVCPSVWAEAAGLVNLEAQSCALPVVTSDVGGIPEYVADGQTGLLFPPGDAVALAERLNRLQADAMLCRQLGAKARERAETLFSPTARLEEYLDLYR